jgi:hypothetical protein
MENNLLENTPLDLEAIIICNLDVVDIYSGYLVFEAFMEDFYTKYDGKLSRWIFDVPEDTVEQHDYTSRKFVYEMLMLPFDLDKLTTKQLEFLHVLQRYVAYPKRTSIDEIGRMAEEKRLARLN